MQGLVACAKLWEYELEGPVLRPRPPKPDGTTDLPCLFGMA
jgi:hypothetical protein